MDSHEVGNNPLDPVDSPDVETVDDPHGGHEEVDVNPRALFIFLAGLVSVVGLVMLLMMLMFNAFEARIQRTDPPVSPLASQRKDYVGVSLEPTSTTEIDQMRTEQQQIMTTYAWIDRRDGIVRVPLEEALKAAAQDGLPQWSAEDAAAEDAAADADDATRSEPAASPGEDEPSVADETEPVDAEPAAPAPVESEQ